MTTTCDSCGVEGETVSEVRRLYITPPAWDTEGKITEAADTERWCLTCIAHYPHQPVEAA